MHPLRPVLRPLPDRCDRRKRRDRRGVGGAARSRALLHGADRALGARRPRRGFRLSAGRRSHRQDLHRDAPPWFQGGVRHQLLRGPHHHGGSRRIRAALHQGRHAAAHHLVLPGMGRLHGETLRGLRAEFLHRQVAAADARRSRQNLLRGKGRHRSGAHLSDLGDALHRQEI